MRFYFNLNKWVVDSIYKEKLFLANNKNVGKIFMNLNDIFAKTTKEFLGLRECPRGQKLQVV